MLFRGGEKKFDKMSFPLSMSTKYYCRHSQFSYDFGWYNNVKFKIIKCKLRKYVSVGIIIVETILAVQRHRTPCRNSPSRHRILIVLFKHTIFVINRVFIQE